MIHSVLVGSTSTAMQPSIEKNKIIYKQIKENDLTLILSTYTYNLHCVNVYLMKK